MVRLFPTIVILASRFVKPCAAEKAEVSIINLGVVSSGSSSHNNGVCKSNLSAYVLATSAVFALLLTIATVSFILFKMLVPWTNKLLNTEREYAEAIPVNVGAALEAFP